jgi:hypothetical protein
MLKTITPFLISVAQRQAKQSGKGRVILADDDSIIIVDLQRWNEEYTQSHVLAFIDNTGAQLIPAFNTQGILQ